GERPEQPTPHGALVVCAIALARAAAIRTGVIAFALRQAAHTERRPQPLRAHVDYGARLLVLEQVLVESDGEDLVRPQARVDTPTVTVEIAFRSVDDVCEITPLRQPEPVPKRMQRRRRERREAALGELIAEQRC